MTVATDDLPNDIERLKALLLAERSEKARLQDQNERLLHMLRQLRRSHFGRKSEQLSDDELNLGLEDLETSISSGEAAAEKADATLKASRKAVRKTNRGNLPAHLPREEIVIDPQAKTCPCCSGDLHMIGEDRSERLDKVSAKYRVIVTRRPKYACRTCERTGGDDTAGMIQAPAPARLIEGGLPTEALVADVVVSKHAWHLPLYRQAQMMVAEGIEIDRPGAHPRVSIAVTAIAIAAGRRAPGRSIWRSPSSGRAATSRPFWSPGGRRRKRSPP